MKKCVFEKDAQFGDERIIQRSWTEDWIVYNGQDRLMIVNTWNSDWQRTFLPSWWVMA